MKKTFLLFLFSVSSFSLFGASGEVLPFREYDKELWRLCSDRPTYSPDDLHRFNSGLPNRFALVGPEYVAFYLGWHDWAKKSISGIRRVVWSADSLKILLFSDNFFSFCNFETGESLTSNDCYDEGKTIVDIALSPDASRMAVLDNSGCVIEATTTKGFKWLKETSLSEELHRLEEAPFLEGGLKKHFFDDCKLSWDERSTIKLGLRGGLILSIPSV